MKHVTAVMLLLFLISGFALAGKDYLIAPDGRHISLSKSDRNEAIPISKLKAIKEKSQPIRMSRSLLQEEYELGWNDGGGHVNFGFDTGDSIALWFVPLAGAIVKRVFLYDINYEGSVEFLIHASNYDGEATTSSCVDGAGWVGYWGHADSTQCDPTGDEDCIWIAGDNECFNSEPFGEELWPGLGIGGYSVDFTADDAGAWVELDLGVLGYPDVGGDPFFVDGLATRSAGWGFGSWDDSETPYHGFKYYLGAGTSGNPGWHIRHYSWEMYLMVEYYEDIPPFILDFDKLPTTTSTEPREVTAWIIDENPTGGAAGVASATLHYRAWTPTSGMGDWAEVAMTATSDTTYAADIPGFEPGSEVRYVIWAEDVEGLRSRTSLSIYNIFEPIEDNLFINNSLFGDWIDYYYFYGVGLYGKEIPYDIWSFGDATQELLDNYTTVVDLSGGGPNACYDFDGAAAWLDAGNKNFLVAGDEWLGACFYGWPAPMEIPAGDFAYDYLGLNYYAADINYAASGDQYGVSRLLAVENDAISGWLFDLLADSLLLNYDPDYEIGASNWLDGVDAVDGADIAYYGLSGILDSVLNVPSDADTFATAVYMEHTNGNKTAFFGFDALSLNTVAVGVDTLHGAGYKWIGIYPHGVVPQTLDWMGALLTIDDEVTQVPKSYALHQNYPNPFNPVTNIQFDIPSDGMVTLSIYNMLGQKVATLVNDNLRAGSHTVTWNGKNDFGQMVATGVYLYRIDAGDYIATKKMVLLK